MKQKLQLIQTGNKLKYKDTDEDLSPLYAKILDRRTISHNPQTVIQFLFGQWFDMSDIDTFEKVFNIISKDPRFRYKNKKQQILNQAVINFKNNPKLEFPEELKHLK